MLLGVGTNLGDRVAHLRAAVDGIGTLGSIDGMSRVYESEPWGYTDQPRFLNMAVRLRTTLDPGALLRALKHLEMRIGRTPTHRMGPRVIDIDILFYDDVLLDSDELVIPHRGMMDRAFVLAPVLDIEPELRHPVTGERLADRLDVIGTGTLVPLGSAAELFALGEGG